MTDEKLPTQPGQPRRATIVTWGPHYVDMTSLTSPQLAGLRAVHAASGKTSGDCFVSKSTETWFDHKTTINSVVANALEKKGLVTIHLTPSVAGYYGPNRVKLTDHGVLALRNLERRT